MPGRPGDFQSALLYDKNFPGETKHIYIFTLNRETVTDTTKVQLGEFYWGYLQAQK